MLPERLSVLVASIPSLGCGLSHPRREPSSLVPTLPRCAPSCQTLRHKKFVICGRGDAGVPLVCDLELIIPTRVPNSAESSVLSGTPACCSTRVQRSHFISVVRASSSTCRASSRVGVCV